MRRQGQQLRRWNQYGRMVEFGSGNETGPEWEAPTHQDRSIREQGGCVADAGRGHIASGEEGASGGIIKVGAGGTAGKEVRITGD